MFCRFWPLLSGWLAPGSFSGTWHFYSKTENPNKYVIYFIVDTSNVSNSELLQRLRLSSNTDTNIHTYSCTYKHTFKIWAYFFCPFVTSCLYCFSQAGKLSSFGLVFTKWLCLVSSSLYLTFQSYRHSFFSFKSQSLLVSSGSLFLFPDSICSLVKFKHGFIFICLF